MTPLRLSPMTAARPWGGGRFGRLADGPIGELWVSGDEAQLPDGRTLAAAGLAGTVPLVKLLDVAERLSVQVHPDDALAREIHGPDAVGKHELWVALAAEPGASIHLGLADGHDPDELFSGDPATVTAALASLTLAPGDVIDVPPGTVHAPGPGLLLYEIQQRSDLTYRIWDWGRDRPTHPSEARRALRPGSRPTPGQLADTAGTSLVSPAGAPFRLERIGVDGPTHLAFDRPTVVSVVEGTISLGGRTAEGVSHWYVGAGKIDIGGLGIALAASA